MQLAFGNDLYDRAHQVLNISSFGASLLLLVVKKAHEDFVPWDELQAKLYDLGLALDANNVLLIRTLLKDLVPDYQPVGEVVDWVWMESAGTA